MREWMIRAAREGDGPRLRTLRLQALADEPTAFTEIYERAWALGPAEWEARIARCRRPARQQLVIAEDADGRWEAMMGAFVGEERDCDAVGLPNPPVPEGDRWAMLWGVYLTRAVRGLGLADLAVTA